MFICQKQIELLFIEGAENPADLFTKNLGRIKFLKFQEQLGLEFYSSKDQDPPGSSESNPIVLEDMN